MRNYILFTIFAVLIFVGFIPKEANAHLNIGIGYSTGPFYSSGLRINMSYGYPHYVGYGSGYYGYGSYANTRIYMSPRFYTPVRYPAPSPQQYMGDYYKCLKHLEVKYAKYLEAKIKEQNEIIHEQVYEQDEISDDYKIDVKEPTEIPYEPKSIPEPKEIDVIEDGSVVVARY